MESCEMLAHVSRKRYNSLSKKPSHNLVPWLRTIVTESHNPTTPLALYISVFFISLPNQHYTIVLRFVVRIMLIVTR